MWLSETRLYLQNEKKVRRLKDRRKTGENQTLGHIWGREKIVQARIPNFNHEAALFPSESTSAQNGKMGRGRKKKAVGSKARRGLNVVYPRETDKDKGRERDAG